MNKYQEALKIIDIVQQIRWQGEKFGYADSTFDDSLREAARYHFGSWENACDVAGVISKQALNKIHPTKKKKIYPPKEDCFAYDMKRKRCDALKETYCLYEKCNFYKPKEEIEND